MVMTLTGLMIVFCMVMLLHHVWGKQLRKIRFFKNLDLSFRGMIVALAILIVVVSVVEVQNLIPPVPLDGTMTERQMTAILGEQTTIAEQTSAGEQTNMAQQTEITQQAEITSQGVGEVLTNTNGITTAPVPAATVTVTKAPAKVSEVVPVTKPVPAPVTKPVATAAPPTQATAVATAVPVTKPITTAAAPQYADGQYTGTGYGFRGAIKVEVTISGGVINDVIVTDHQEDLKWYNRAYYGVVERILEAQSSSVDSVSGATYSSIGIIDGVYEALEKSKAAKK